LQRGRADEAQARKTTIVAVQSASISKNGMARQRTTTVDFKQANLLAKYQATENFEPTVFP
jgi:hypothetical protein